MRLMCGPSAHFRQAHNLGGGRATFWLPGTNRAFGIRGDIHASKGPGDRGVRTRRGGRHDGTDSGGGAMSTAAWVTTYANVDGRGGDERVTIRDVSETQHEMVVTFDDGTIERYRFDVMEGMAPRTPRITDIDGRDGEEVLVTTSAGANTMRFRILTRAEGRWLTVKGSGNRVFDLWEGGGMSAASRYRCEGTTLLTVNATLDSNGRTYSGKVNKYKLNGAKVDWFNTTSFSGVAKNDPVLSYGTGSCAR